MFFVRPKRLGVINDRLQGCPASPNCVCSQDGDPTHFIQPLVFHGDWQAARDRLLKALRTLPGLRVVTVVDRYVYATATTLVFRFVDDLEALIDPAAGVIHLRSASRLGYSDLGVNRRRVERLRKEFDALAVVDEERGTESRD